MTTRDDRFLTIVMPKTHKEYKVPAFAPTRAEYAVPDGAAYTSGVEMEYLIDDRGTNFRIEDLFGGDFEGWSTPECWRNIGEVKTDPHSDMGLLMSQLRDRWSRAQTWLSERGATIMPLSAHPFDVVGTLPDFEFITRIARSKHGFAPMLLNSTACLQVTNATHSGNAAIYVQNASRAIGALILAMSNSSPFFNKGLSGLESIRHNLRGLAGDGNGMVPEFIPEGEWGEYIRYRTQACSMTRVAQSPASHNRIMRIRWHGDDATICNEIGFSEVLGGDLRRIEDMIRFLRNLHQRLLIAYKEDEPLPNVFGPRGIRDELALRWLYMEAAIRGLDGDYLGADYAPLIIRDAAAELMAWVGGEYPHLASEAPATGWIRQWNALVDGGCDPEEATIEVVEDIEGAFALQFQSVTA